MSVAETLHKPHFDDSIRRTEEQTYYPYVKSFESNDMFEMTKLAQLMHSEIITTLTTPRICTFLDGITYLSKLPTG